MLELGTEQRYDIYDLFLDFPQPLAPRDLRLEVAERIDRDGRVVTALDQDEARRVLRRLAEDGCEAIAVCFINAYRNPEHERAVGRIAAEEISRSRRSRSRATSLPSCGNTSAASPPAPTPMCSR